MAPDAGIVEHGDITIDSNHETVDQIQLAFADEADTPAVADTADAPGSAPPAEPAPETAPDTAAPVAAASKEEPESPVSSKERRRNARAAVQAAITKQREAERRADKAEARLEVLAPPADSPQAAPQPDWARFKALPAAPKADQFENYDDYTAALATFVTDARQHEHETRRHEYLQAQSQEQAHEAHAAQWQERLAQARVDTPDLDATLDPTVPMSLPMQYLAMESPVGIQILQYLSAHPDESQRMSTLHPAEVYRSMGKLEERLSAASRPSGPARSVSHAKPPIQPLGSSPHAPDASAVTDDLSFEEHFKRMNAQDRKHGRL
jgi:transcription elongation GreA/GreB family factor